MSTKRLIVYLLSATAGLILTAAVILLVYGIQAPRTVFANISVGATALLIAVFDLVELFKKKN